MKKIIILIAFLSCGFYAAQALSAEAEPQQLAQKNIVNGDLAEDFLDLPEEEVLVVSDPIEPVNRAMFWFNDKLYFYVLKPVAKGYRNVMPEPARISVSNFFSNLAAPIRIVNNLFQFKFRKAGLETARFAINTTAGVLGIFDFAEDYAKLPEEKEDFGQTMGSYGVGNGPYLVLPFLGPSNLRDGVGTIVDSFFDPVAYMDKTRDYVGVKFVESVNTISLDKDTYEGIKRDALDPYLFIRDAYTQHRNGKIEE
jgi:phospholipid-binding lipoprotein MlaA